IVPDHDPPSCRSDRQIEEFEAGGAAPGRLIEVDHRRPGALAAVLLRLQPIRLVDVEEVGMVLELLPDMVALALERLPENRVQSEQRADPPIDLGDQRVERVEIAGVTGPGL